MRQKLELKYLVSQIEPFYGAIEDKDTVYNLDIVVFWVDNTGLNTWDMLNEEKGTANIQIVAKPVNSAEVKAILMDSSVQQNT